MAFAIDGGDAPERRPLGRIYSMILGGGGASRLFKEIREKRGLGYMASAGYGSVPDASEVGIFAGVGGGNLREATQTIQDVLRSMLDVSDRELERAKTKIRASYLIGGETSMSRADRLSLHMMRERRIVPHAESLAHIEAVTTSRIREFAAEVLGAPMSLVVSGDVEAAIGADEFSASLAA